MMRLTAILAVTVGIGALAACDRTPREERAEDVEQVDEEEAEDGDEAAENEAEAVGDDD